MRQCGSLVVISEIYGQFSAWLPFHSSGLTILSDRRPSIVFSPEVYQEEYHCRVAYEPLAVSHFACVELDPLIGSLSILLGHTARNSSSSLPRYKIPVNKIIWNGN